MNDNLLISFGDEQAKAIQEVAKATGTALELARDAGTYIADVLGTVPKDLIGVLGGDWLGEVRIRNFVRYKVRTAELHCERGVTETAAVSPSLAVPLLRAAADESRIELQELWARLLANATDPALNSVRHVFVSAVQAMDPPDVVLMSHLSANNVTHVTTVDSSAVGTRVAALRVAATLGTSDDAVIVSLQHLEELGLLMQHHGGIWSPSPLSREFFRACYPELSEKKSHPPAGN